ncbi:MAG: hypothetical protein HC838_17805 [Spirulinaceae cyanobacterium RM2_2_10]|nr:hypothetical protein [Spirulinaceae cyanobacterium RM2_2_10]
MNAVLTFVLGFSLGLVIYGWERYRFWQHLRQMLSFLPAELNETSSLSLVSRLRRGIKLTVAGYEERSVQVERLAQILAAAPIGYLQVDANDQLHWCNAYSRNLLKIDRWRPGQARLLLELVRSYELDRLVAATRATGQPQLERWVYQTTAWQAQSAGDAASVPYAIAVRARSLPLAEGEVGIFLDNLQQLTDLQQSRDRTFADLAHELRTR